MAAFDDVTSEEKPPEVLLSAIEHFSYCPRQCGLIHVEQCYEENRYTVRGSQSHERVHSGEEGVVAGVEVRRSVPLWSARLGLRGQSDLIEMRPGGPYPVEYKVGGKHTIHAEVQLCAQALCLEEMLGCTVTAGAVYHIQTRRRVEVRFDADLRRRTLAVIEAIRSMLAAQDLPAAVNDPRCRNCSLEQICLPDVSANPLRLRGLNSALYIPADATAMED